MMNVVTLTNQIEFGWKPSLWELECVTDGATNVNRTSDEIWFYYPSLYEKLSVVLIWEIGDVDEGESSTYPKCNKDVCSAWSPFWCVGTWKHAGQKATERRNAYHCEEPISNIECFLACKAIENWWHRAPPNQDRNASVVQTRQELLNLWTLNLKCVIDDRCTHAAASSKHMEEQWKSTHIIQNERRIYYVSYLEHRIVFSKDCYF